jgi:hypothetical protein
VFWYNAANVLFASDMVEATGLPAANGALETYRTVGGLFTAPTGVHAAAFNAYAAADGVTASPVGRVARPMLALARDEQTQLAPYVPGMRGQAGADVTGQHISAGFVGQGPLSTSQLTEAQVRGRFLGEFASEAAALAAGLQDGDTWRRSSDGAQFGRVGGVSVAVALPQLSATASAYAVSGTRADAGSVTTGSVTVTGAGGVAPYSYAWNLVGGVTSTASASTATTTTFTGTADPAPAVSTWQCTVTDAEGAVVHVQIRAAFVLSS